MASVEVGDDQRRRVIDAAHRLFAKHGFDGVTMAEIAEKSNVARASVFNYFGSKYALIEAITETVLDFYGTMLRDALEDKTTPTPDLIRKLAEDMGLGIETQRRLFQGVFREIARVELGLDAGEVAQRATKNARIQFLQLLMRGQDRGDVSTEFSAKTLTAAFHSLVNGTIVNWLYGDLTGDLATDLRNAVEVFLSPIETQGRRRNGR